MFVCFFKFFTCGHNGLRYTRDLSQNRIDPNQAKPGPFLFDFFVFM